MPIVDSELILYGAASRPNDDTSTVGGAIDLTNRPVFTQFSAAAQPEISSDGADTRTVTIVGRDAGGSIISEGPTALNGATPVLFSSSFERILTVTISATDGARTVVVKQGSGGTTRVTIGPDESSVSALFRRSSSSSVQRIRYEKVFFKNTNGTLTLTSATITLSADPSAEIEVGCAPSVDDTATATNRLTAPGSVTFVDDSTAQGVPGGELAAGEAIGVWAKQTRAIDAGPVLSTFTVQLAGQST